MAAPQDRRARFVLSSEQCELLVAFAATPTLAALARHVAREASVVSRQLKRIAETAPVLEKRKGRWWLTPLGAQICQATRTAIDAQRRLIDQEQRLSLSESHAPALDRSAVLLAVGCQLGFDDPAWGQRNNPGAEANIARLLSTWRRARMPIVHARHESREPRSPLRAGSKGAAFKPEAEPRAGEIVLTKTTNSAFASTDLEQILRRGGHDAVVIVGFTANQCVDATARYASDAGFSAYVVRDAIATFDRVGPDGYLLSADELQRAALTSLNQEFATVVDTASMLRPIEP